MGRRRFERFPVERQVVCHAGDIGFTATLYDLSVGGCMIEASIFPAEGGTELRLCIDHLAEVSGRIVWRCGPNAGIRFHENLNAALVRFCGFPAERIKFDDMTPCDRFGRSLPKLRWF